MPTTTLSGLRATVPQSGQAQRPSAVSPLLRQRYAEVLADRRLQWSTHHRLMRRLGQGGQGIVFLSERRGTDGFTLPVAIKVFSPENFASDREYEESMQRIGRVASHVARIQHDNVLDVHNFVDHRRIRVMVMEWVDGYDLQQLLVPSILVRTHSRVSRNRWEYLNRVVVTAGISKPRFKAGVAVHIVRECLSGLAALHRARIVHGDIKPSNVMLKRTGHAKIVDFGSAFDANSPPSMRTCTPAYAALEVLEGAEATPHSDLASLGYVLIELLAGCCPFTYPASFKQLLEEKRQLPHQLHKILPAEVTVNELLMNFCRRLIAVDPARRFDTAEAAELMHQGAAEFQRQLVLGNMSSEYTNEIRVWLEELGELESSDSSDDQTGPSEPSTDD